MSAVFGSKYIKGFDGLRGIAVLLVLIDHLGLYLILPKSEFWKQRLWDLFAGETGVYIFFALSGFLITNNLLREKRTNNKIGLKRFYFRRALRLAPALLVFLITLAALIMLGELSFTPLALLFSAVYSYNYATAGVYVPELAHTWSLGVEEQFYLLWPLAINCFGVRKLISIAGIAVVLSGIVVLVFPKWLIVGPFVFIHLTRWFLPAVGPIMIGSIGAILLNNKFNERLFKITYSRAMWILILGFYCSSLWLPLALLKEVFLIQSLGITLLLLWIMKNQSSIFVRVLEFPLLAKIGRISYGIYIWQGLFLRNGPGGKLLIQNPPWNIGLTFLVALLSYYFIERRLLRLKERI